MRVCMITHSLYESDGRVMRYAEALAARGDEVDVIALRRGGKPKREVIAGVRVYRVLNRSFTEKHKLSFLKQVALFFAVASWIVTKEHLRRPYDLLHIHSIPDNLVFAGWLPRLTGARIILDIHDILPELYASKFGADRESFGFKVMLLLERYSISFANHVIIANDLWKQRLVSRSLSSDKCSVFLNYPDRRVFRPGHPMPHPNKRVLIYPGTLNRHQGLDVAIRAFAQVKDQLPDAEFHIYGEGRMQDLLVKAVRELKLESRVLFKPMLPLREIARVMAGADLAVVPKRKDSFGDEAFSTKILEFMAVGVPIIVSDTKIDHYYFNESVVAFFRDGDEHDLASKMLLVLNDYSLRQKLVRNAFEFVQRFDWEPNKQRYLKLVDSLMEGKQVEADAPVVEDIQRVA